MHLVRKIPTLPPRPADGHKGTFGTVLVVAGSPGMLGAAILAARGALRGGAGLVRVCLLPSLRAALTVAVPCATTLSRKPPNGVGEAQRWLQGVSSVVIGPGLGVSATTRQLVRRVLTSAKMPVVVDADGLSALSPLRAALPGKGPVVLTPHPGEAARLLRTDTATVQADRREAVVELAERTGRIVVLKGARTLVADGERIFQNKTGNPGMATGGSGDVLSGLLGALMAQGMDPFDAACLGVHVHGMAGDRMAATLSQTGLCADDLPEAIAEVLTP